MKNVSNAFKAQMQNNTEFYATAEITFLDGRKVSISKADFNLSGNTIVQGGATSSFPLGVVSSKQITLSLLNDNDKWADYGFYNAEIKLFTNFQTNESPDVIDESFAPVIERIQEGIFTVIQPESYGTTVEITAMDGTYKTDSDYTTTLLFPVTVAEALRDACSACGITLYSDNFPNNDFQIKEKPSSGTFREFIGYCAMIAGGNAVMDNYNRLKIISYDFSAFKDTESETKPPVLKDFTPGLRYEASDVVITGLQIEGEVKITDEEGNETTESKLFKYGEDGYVLQLRNDLAKGSEEDFLQRVGELIAGSKFRAFTGDHIANPLVEFMDLAYIQDYRGNKYPTVITDVNFSYFGITVLKCAAETPLRNGQTGSNAVTEQVRKLVEREKNERERAIKRLNDMLSGAGGLYITEDKQSDGSTIIYLHNKPTLEESDTIIKITDEAVGISNDGGENYIYGLTYDGEAILRKIYAEGIDADYITTGHLTADKIRGGTLTLGGLNNENGQLFVLDENGETIGIWDKEGIEILKGRLSAALIVGGILTLGGLNNQHGILNILDENGELIGKWDKEGITATMGNFAGNITVGGKVNGVCKVLDEEGTETVRLDTNGLSLLGSEENLLINFDWTGMWVYNDKAETPQKVGQIGLTYRGDDYSLPGVILGLDPDGEVIGFGVADTVSGKYSSVFAYARTEDALAAGKDLNMNGHRIYNVVIDGGETVSGGVVGEFTNEGKNSEIFNSYKDTESTSDAPSGIKNYINSKTSYAHVSGNGNSIDKNIESGTFSLAATINGGEKNSITDTCVYSAILGGSNNKITKSQYSGIIAGNTNTMGERSVFSCIVGGLTNNCESIMSFIGGGNLNKINVITSQGNAICGGIRNEITKQGFNFIGGGNGNSIANYSSAIIGSDDSHIKAPHSAICGGNNNQILDVHNSDGSFIGGGNGNKTSGIRNAIVSGFSINIDNAYCCGAIGGTYNQIIQSFQSAVIGANNTLANCVNCFVAGEYNKCENLTGCIVCGTGAKPVLGMRLVIGNGDNAFWVDYSGNVYANSFNIIGENAASEASAFSSKSTTPDLSELTEQLTQIKADIEALKAENQTLRTEIERLKTDL